VLSYFQGLFVGLTTSFGGEVSGTYDNLVLDHSALDDQYIRFNTTFAGEVTGNSSNIVLDHSALDDQYLRFNTTFAGEVTGNSSNIVLDHSALDDQYIRFNTTFAGDVSGNSSAIIVADDSHNHTCLNITAGTDPDYCVDDQLTEEEVTDYAGGMWTGNTETGISITFQDGDNTIDAVVDFTGYDNCSEIADCVSNAWDAQADIATDGISEIKIDMDTVCGSGSHLYVSGNDFACEADADTTLSEEEVEDFVGGMLGGTETGIAVTYEDGTNDIDFVVDFTGYDECSEISGCVTDAWDANADLATDEIAEIKIDLDTVCAAGSHLYISGNDLACETDDYNSAFDTEDEVEAAIFDSDNTANLGMGDYNVTAVDCIVFTSGGKICSG
jgi:hypothetical protein